VIYQASIELELIKKLTFLYS